MASSTGLAIGTTLNIATGNQLSSFGNFTNIVSGDNNLLNNYNSLSNLFGYNNNVEIKNTQVQISSEGILIPEVYGSCILAGNIIWCSDIQTISKTSAPVTTKQGVQAGETQKTTLASFAIAICQGEIDAIINIYADGELLDISKYDIEQFTGSRNQPKSEIMMSNIDKEIPNFQNLCYVVFANFPLNNFGNRIPNFTFEISNNIETEEQSSLRNAIKGITIIPGSGEFVYDTEIQQKKQGYWQFGRFIETSKATHLNHHNNSNQANAIITLNNLEKEFPELEWISIIVCWFCDNLDISKCSIYPACEYKNMITFPNEWSVGSVTRELAREITKDSNNRPIYGGTPSDQSIINFIQEAKKRGYKICLYPMLMIDDNQKSWRGFLTGHESDVHDFFNKNAGYNNFILHYANMCKNLIDGFVIGSEMNGLTQIQNQQNIFPAVDEFCDLAQKVKNILGSDVITTYAANWDEYHHTQEGFFNLDKLWSHNAIDRIGIDAYFPLSHSRGSIYDIETIKQGWHSGEGYDFYYSDSEKTEKQPLEPKYAWKNIKYFWENEHYNPDGTKTNWIPKMKKIWFTEYGFPSVNSCTNQPNVFWSTTNPQFPILSSGEIDFAAQQTAILATEQHFQNSEYVDLKFLWTYDARPYPFFPVMKSVWTDAEDWKYGHWVNGKVYANNSLRALIHILCQKNGLLDSELDTTELEDARIYGIVIDKRRTTFDIIKHLSTIFSFEICLKDGKICFQSINAKKEIKILHHNRILFNDSWNDFIKITKSSSIQLPKKINFSFLDLNNDQKIASVSIKTSDYKIGDTEIDITSNIIINSDNAKNMASNILYRELSQNIVCEFLIDDSYYDKFHLFDILQITQDDKIIHQIKINDIQLDHNDGIMKIIGNIHNQEFRKNSQYYDIQNTRTLELDNTIHLSVIEPNLLLSTYTTNLLLYLHGYTENENFSNIHVYISYDLGMNYEYIKTINQENVYGFITDFYIDSSYPLISNNYIQIAVPENKHQLRSIYLENLLNNSDNVCVINNCIFQFKTIETTQNNEIILKNLLFNRTLDLNINIGDTVLFLNTNNTINIPREYLNQTVLFKAISNNGFLEDAKEYSIQPKGGGMLDIEPNVKQEKNNNGDIVFIIQKQSSVNDFWIQHSDRKYFLQIIKNNTMLRYIPENNNHFVYSAQEQQEDFDKLLDYVENYQIVQI